MEHPFAKFIQILGKGQRGARDLTQQEAEQAMSMILAHQVEPVQLYRGILDADLHSEKPPTLLARGG